ILEALKTIPPDLDKKDVEGHLVNKTRDHLDAVARAKRGKWGKVGEVIQTVSETTADDREARRLLKSIPAPAPDAPAMVSSDEARERPRDIRTPQEYRVVEMTYWGDHGDGTIAADLAIDVRSVQQTRYRALKKLRANKGDFLCLPDDGDLPLA